jgi:hypothetical protein
LRRTKTHQGFGVGKRKFMFASWVDNIYMASMDAAGAIWLGEHFEDHIMEVWDLRLKPSSKEVLVCRGSEHAINDKWKQVQAMAILGHIIEDDGAVRMSWEVTKRTIIKASWANLRHPSATKLPPNEKIRLVSRAVVPQFTSKCTR